LFVRFEQMCYLEKFGEAAKKKQKKEEATFQMVRVHCSKMKKQPPSDNIMLRQCRQVSWNLEYILNASRNILIDAFEVYQEKSYYGYDKDSMQIVDIVASKQKPVDEICKKHFWKRKQKEQEMHISEKRKRSAIEKIKGNF